MVNSTITISQEVDALAAEVVLMDASDPQGLAKLHERFEATARAATADDAPSANALSSQAKKGSAILEKLILGDAPDIQKAMDDVIKLVIDLQATLSGESRAMMTGTTESSIAAVPTAAAGPYDGPEPDFGADGDTAMAREFISEARSHIEAAEAALLALEHNGDDPESVNALFRAFHTIKGTAGFVNLKQIPRLAHLTENLLDLARQDQLQVVGPIADVVLDAIDRTKEYLAQLQKAVEARGAPPTDPQLQTLLGRLAAAVHPAHTAPPADAASRAASGVESLANHTGKAAPQAESSSPAMLSGAGQTAKEPEVILFCSPTVSSTPEETPALGEQKIPSLSSSVRVSDSPALESSPAGATPKAGAASKSGPDSSAGEGMVKVATERLDRLINSVGELVIAQAMLEQSLNVGHEAAVPTARGLTHLGKLTRELQDLAMSMRMVPIQGVFQKMARLARDLTRKSDKQIEFASHGGETELDRNLVEAISDPLVHMIRNSADHGIELPHVREAAGKPKAGKITLSAYHQGGSVVIEIRDDGRGLAKKRIVEKAIDRGIIKPDQSLSDQEIFALIFHAGLSTAEKITDVSGRGVGMDVVKRNIESLRGRIEIESTEGVGAVFTIRLPLTLAVIDGLVVRVGTERFVIPLLGIEQSMRLTPEQVSTVQGRGEMAMVRNSLIPITRLHRMFNIHGAVEKVTDGLVVIVQDNLRRRALLVDGLTGRQQVVIKSLGEGIGQVRGVSGGAILGDGKVSLILDVPSLLDLTVDG